MTPNAPDSSTKDPQDPTGIEAKIQGAGQSLLDSFTRVLGEIPEAAAGPQKLAAALGVDKVLASRLLKAMRSPDAMCAVHRAPGPDPMRRVLRSASKLGVDADAVSEAEAAVDIYEHLIQAEIGDRSALDAILSVWVPGARREFELRRKQAAFRAMSQIKGVETSAEALTTILIPNPDGVHLDAVGINAMIGLRRLRPGAPVHFSTSIRKRGSDSQLRHTNLQGEAIDSFHNTLLPEFSTNPLPPLHIRDADPLTSDASPPRQSKLFYMGETGVGASSTVDLVTCQAVWSARKRYKKDSSAGRYWVSYAVSIPTRVSQFDFVIHDEVFPDQVPELCIYDTMVHGLGDINDPARDFDKLDLLGSVESLGKGIQRFGSSAVTRYRPLLTHVFDELGLDGSRFRGYRVTIDFPIYGSQFVLSFEMPDPPGEQAQS